MEPQGRRNRNGGLDMGNKDHHRSGAQTAADLARAARAIYNVIRAALAAGLKGAAVAAVKETLPFLVKLAVGILIAVLLIPMLIFTALPNIFFGYGASDTPAVIDMTTQALSIGGAYMSLEDFENTQVDSVITSMITEYEEQGVKIGRVEVDNSMREEDLLWLIAINSAAHQQDLNAMSADQVLDFCSSKLIPSFSLIDGLEEEVTLKVKVEHIDPEQIMESMGFDEDAKTWAGALHETLFESDALNEYADFFEPYKPDYSGDGSWSGEVEHGASYGNEIDISGFVSPDTKNNLDLAAYAIQAWENNWGYVWGTYGNVLTESLFEYKLKQYPEGVGDYEDFIRENWLGRRTADCIGLLKGYAWLDTTDMTIGYAENGAPDYGANQMYQYVKESGEAGEDYGGMASMPEIPGLMLWKEGHAGVYIGGGYAIEAMSTKYGVVKTEVDGRGWEGWGKLPFLEYLEDE